jgi:multidrug efflux pump subunit AcrB
MRHFAIGCVLGILGLAPGCGSKTADRCDASSILVEVRYPGASVAEIEQGVVIPLEHAVTGPEVRALHAIVEPGVARLYLLPRGKLEDATRATRERLAAVTSLPVDAESPWLFPLSANQSQLIAVSGDASSEALSAAAAQVRHQLARERGIDRIIELDSAESEMRVELDPHRLAAYGLDADAVLSALRARSFELPAGAAVAPGGEFALRVGSDTGADLGRVVVAIRPDGAPVYLSDIAAIRDRPPALHSRVDGRPAVLLALVGARLSADGLDGLDLAPGLRVERIGTPSTSACELPQGLGLSIAPGPRTVTARVVFPAGTRIEDRELVLAHLAQGVVERLRVDGVAATTVTRAGPIGELGVVVDSAAAARAASVAAVGVGAETPGVQITVHGGEFVTTVVRLGHPDLDELSAAVDEFGRALGGAWAPGAVAAAPTLEFRVEDRARALGVTAQDLARTLRLMHGGVEVARVQRGRSEVRVVVSLRGGAPPDAASIPVRTPAGALVPLGELVAIERVQTTSRIERYDGRRVAYVLTGGGPGEAARARDARPALVAAHPGLTFDFVSTR